MRGDFVSTKVSCPPILLTLGLLFFAWTSVLAAAHTHLDYTFFSTCTICFALSFHILRLDFVTLTIVTGHVIQRTNFVTGI